MGTLRDTTVLFKGWLTLLRASVTAPAGHVYQRLIEDHGSAVAVLPYDAARQTVIVISQFRAPVAFLRPGGPDLLEPIAGRLDDDDPDSAARRETLEEAGLALRELESVGAYWTMPALSTEQIHLYLAPYRNDDRVSAGGGLAEEDEDIRVHEITFAELFAQARRGGIDVKLLALSQALQSKISNR